jgi:hypothetical protein
MVMAGPSVSLTVMVRSVETEFAPSVALYVAV